MDNKDDKNDTKWWKEEDNTLNYAFSSTLGKPIAKKKPKID